MVLIWNLRNCAYICGTNQRHIMKRIGLFLRWQWYVFCTIEDRNRYNLGLIYGQHCLRIERSACSSVATFDTKRKPKREFMTKDEWYKSIEA